MNVNNNNTNINKTYTTPTPTPTPAPVEKQLHVSRELDGVNNDGIIGELLTQGTSNLAEANKYFAMTQYATTGLLSQNNKLTPDAAKLYAEKGSANDTGILCGDDMYVAGDPGVGGKGNNYSWVDIDVTPGYYTMFQDGAESGSKITVNSHVEAINPQGDKAFTEYGFVVQDEQGVKTQATLSGGQFTIVDGNGQTKKLLPPNDVYYVGNPMDPTAKFYYADVPGAGENGASEKRLMVDYYEKPTQATVDKLVAEGANPTEVANMRTQTTLSYGFRVPDGVNTYASSEGVGAGSAKKTTDQGVKTYYDSHYTEGPCSVLNVCATPTPTPTPTPYPPTPTPTPTPAPTPYPPTPTPTPAPTPYPPTPTPTPTPYPPTPTPTPPVAANEHARSWGDPHIEDADGGKYNFHHPGIFNIVKDKDVQLNAKITASANNTAVNTEAGVTVGGRTVYVTADGTTKVGYKDPNIVNADVTLADGQTVLLDDGGSVSRAGNKVTVQTTEYKMQFDTNKDFNGTKYMDIDVWSKAGGVMTDGVAPSGILGETFDADSDQVTAPKQDLDSYKEDSILQKSSTVSDLPDKLPNTGNPSHQIIQSVMSEFSSDGNYTAAKLTQAANSERVKGSVYESVFKALADMSAQFNRPVTPANIQAVAKKGFNDDFLSANDVKTMLADVAGWNTTTTPTPAPAPTPATPTPTPTPTPAPTPPPAPPTQQETESLNQIRQMFQQLLAMISFLFGGVR